MRVVIVDDEPDIRFLVGRLLSLAGWEVVGEAGNGSEAVELVAALQPDAVVLDLMMPTPGDAALPHLVAVAPGCMVSIFSAADAGPDELQRLRALGAFSYHSKSDMPGLPDRLAADYRRFSALAG